ncbi:MAG: hypothetical protein ACREP6_11130, partial [Candidatus Binataceae bacterium]
RRPGAVSMAMALMLAIQFVAATATGADAPSLNAPAPISTGANDSVSITGAATAPNHKKKLGIASFASSLRAKLQNELFNNGTDPSDPVNQFSIRNYYFSYKNGEFRDNVIFRVDETPREGLSLSAEVPLSTAYRKKQHYYGAGDSYVDAIYTPWKTDYFGIAVGGAMVMPTASSASLGSGKWQFAPIVIPLAYPLGKERLLTYLEFRNFVSVASIGRYNFVSVAGDAPFSETEGSRINYLELTPVVRYTISERWYLYAEPVFMTVNWENGNALSYRSALRVGHMITDRIGMWVQPEVPFGSNRTGYFNVKLAILYRY